jgi:rhodanese-related sulfurtransferase
MRAPAQSDVREPDEYAAGHIPRTHNMPITTSPDGLFLPADDFFERFGFAKPRRDDEVVFYCKAGVRSRGAAGLAEQAGYAKVGEYRGSWLDWAKNVEQLREEAGAGKGGAEGEKKA